MSLSPSYKLGVAKKKSRKSDRVKAKRPPKHENVLELVKTHVERGTYVDTRHAATRRAERDITLPEILHVLRRGFWEKRKDQYKDEHESWTYAIRGKTVDGRSLRIAVAFETPGMLLITAIDLDVK